MPLSACATTWLKRIFGLLVVIFALQAITAWEVHGIRKAVEAQEEIMPSQETRVPITVNEEESYTDVTTTFREAPNTNETDAQWDARHIATCARIKAAWEAVE